MNLINDIDEWLLNQESRPRESHYASDATACKRQLYYKHTGQPISNPIEAGGLWKMRMGDAIHELIQEFLSKKGYDIVDEVSVKKQYEGLTLPVSLRVDALFAVSGQYYGVEVKSTYGAGVVNIKKNNAPKPEHLAQICLYADAYGIDDWFLLYIGRDNGYRCQFEAKYDKATKILWCAEKATHLDSILENLRLLETYVEDRELPPREFWAAIKNGEIKDKFQEDSVMYKSNWQCAYCNYRDHCWADELSRCQIGSNSDTYIITEVADE